MESTWYNVFTKKKRNPKVMALPTTSTHLLQHMLWAHLQSCCGNQPIVKVLQVSQEISQTLGGSFESKFVYGSLLKVTLLHMSYLM